MWYQLEVHELGHRIPVGCGYSTFDMARNAAMKKVDDALPHNTVHVLQDVGHAAFGGDGEPYWADSVGPKYGIYWATRVRDGTRELVEVSYGAFYTSVQCIGDEQEFNINEYKDFSGPVKEAIV